MHCFDELETRAPEAREAALMAALPAQIAHAKKNAPGFARILAGVDAAGVNSRQALAKPDHAQVRPGRVAESAAAVRGLNATPVAKMAKLFVSPGPVYEPEGHALNWWRAARGLFAAGLRAGDLVVNTFSYHFTPAGVAQRAARALGCVLVPTGTGQTEMQVTTIAGLRVRGYIGTPSFLKLIVEKADELKADVSSLTRASVGAEYLPPTLRQAMRERGIRVTQTYGTADLGLIAYESAMPDGTVNDGMILEEALILEIVRPGTGDPVAPGEVGKW